MDAELGLAYFVVATVVTLIVEWIRKALVNLEGRVVNLIAWAVGLAATFAPIAAFAEFNDVLPDLQIEGRLAAGLALAGLGSLIAEVKGVLTNTRKLRRASLESIGHGEEAYAPQPDGVTRFDEGYNPGDPGYNPETGTFDPTRQPPSV